MVFQRITGNVEARVTENGLEFVGNGWTRSIRLAGAALTIDQTPALPADPVTPQTNGNVSLSVDRTPSRVVYTLQQAPSREP